MKDALKQIVDLIGERFDVGVDATTETAIEDILNNLSDAAFDRGLQEGRDVGYSEAGGYE